MHLVLAPRRFTLLALLSAKLLATAPLAADTFQHRGTPTLDGIEGVGEWTGAEAGTTELVLPAIFGGGTSNVTFYAMNDDLFLYAAVRIPVNASPDSPAALGVAGLAWPYSNPTCAGEILIDHFEIISQENLVIYWDAYRDTCAQQSAADVSDGGSTDTGGTWAISSNSHFFELAQPLDSGDDLHDLGMPPPGFIFVDLVAIATNGMGDDGNPAEIVFRMFLATANSIVFANFETGNLTEWSTSTP